MPSSPSLDVGAAPVHSHSIMLKLRDINQLFNSMDPSPFIEKDLRPAHKLHWGAERISDST